MNPRIRLLLGMCAALACAIYVFNAWSPSSHALALRLFGAEDDGLVLGRPRDIRSDEWAVITPLTQATVNNGFRRYNGTSLYGEDLRLVFSLPVFDWGMAFKPTMWGYAVLPPANAFSLHHLSILVLFLVGYPLLFRRLGTPLVEATLLGGALFFSGFTQYWWSTLGPPLAAFPWLLLIWIWEKPLWIRAPLFFWAGTSWLLAFFYPPIFIPLALLAFVLLLAYRRDTLSLSNLLGLGFAGAMSCIVAVGYLRDWFRATLETVYPGKRFVGGGDYGVERALSHLFPTALQHGHHTLVPNSNICEMGVLGSAFILLAIAFLDHRALGRVWAERRVAPLLPLLAGCLLVGAWLFLPIPAWAGAPLLFSFVPTPRMAFTFGALLLLTAHAAVTQAGLRVTPVRAAMVVGAVFGVWFIWKWQPHQLSVARSWKDFLPAVIAVTVAGAVLLKRFEDSWARPALMGGAVLAAALSFGNFNPLQSAHPIFERPSTPLTRELDALAEANGGLLVRAGIFGALLNGWGYRSAAHTLPTPQVDRFRALFPELEPADVNNLFNRYAHVTLTEADRPSLIAPDAVWVPKRVFSQPESTRDFSHTRSPPRAP